MLFKRQRYIFYNIKDVISMLVICLFVRKILHLQSHKVVL